MQTDAGNRKIQIVCPDCGRVGHGKYCQWCGARLPEPRTWYYEDSLEACGVGEEPIPDLGRFAPKVHGKRNKKTTRTGKTNSISRKRRRIKRIRFNVKNILCLVAGVTAVGLMIAASKGRFYREIRVEYGPMPMSTATSVSTPKPSPSPTPTPTPKHRMSPVN